MDALVVFLIAAAMLRITSGAASVFDVAESGLAAPRRVARAPLARAAVMRREPAPAPADLEGLRAVCAAMNEPRVLEAAARETCRALAAKRAVFHGHDRRADRFEPLAMHPLASELAPETCVSMDPRRLEPLLRLASRRRAVIRKGAGDSEADEAFAVAGEGASCAAPVFERAVVAGVLVVHGATDRQGAADLLAVYAAVCGSALASARMARECERLQQRDTLTGLPSVDELCATVSDHLRRGPVAVLLLCADQMRQINVRYGRRAGDRTLAALARLVALEVADRGVLGRYGGATLLVVLPGDDRSVAENLAARLRERVKDSLRAGGDAGGEALTLSVGVAERQGGPVEELLREAEFALQEAAGAGSMLDVEADDHA